MKLPVYDYMENEKTWRKQKLRICKHCHCTLFIINIFDSDIDWHSQYFQGQVNTFMTSFIYMLKKAEFILTCTKPSSNMERHTLKYSALEHNILNMHCIFIFIQILLKFCELPCCYIPCYKSWLIFAFSYLDDLSYLSNTYWATLFSEVLLIAYNWIDITSFQGTYI